MHLYIRLVTIWFIVVIVVSGQGRVRADNGTSPAPHGVAYEVLFEGLADDGGLLGDLRLASQSVLFLPKPPSTLNQLRFRAQQDVPRLKAVLRNEGYYQARLTSRIDRGPALKRIIFTIAKGPRFRLGPVTIEVEPPSRKDEIPAVTGETLGLPAGEPATAARILKTPDRLQTLLRNDGFALAEASPPKVTVDHGTLLVNVVLKVSPGPRAKFGRITVTGLETLEEKVVLRRIPWQAGDRFDPKLLDKARDRITKTKLFAVVRVTPMKALDPDNRLPVEILLKERKHRTITAGASYLSDEGAGTKLGWEHRNLTQHADKLRVNAAISERGYALEGNFERPAFMTDRLLLGFKTRWAEERTDAFDSSGLENALTLTYEFSEKLYAGVGTEVILSEIDQLGLMDRYLLVGFPFTARWDNSDDLFDPQSGLRINALAAPYLDLQNDGSTFLKIKGEIRWYARIAQTPHTVLAVKAGGGTLWGGGLNSVPADFRFYAGGGGSVRGYGYQLLSPMLDGSPIGGRSLIELSSELRVRVTSDIGVVLFVDGGNAFDDPRPDLQERLYFGGGIGLRYYTPIGPLRFDVAVPFERRGGLDDAFQYYISIGQAF